MANQCSSSSSRRTKRSNASSAKDASLGKKVVVDPRVRIHTLKAARDTVDLEDDSDNNAGSSNPSSYSASTSTSAFPSNSRMTSSRPNWKRVPLKRCTPHSLLVKPCGPGKIIMPSVPRRKRPTKPNGDDDDDGDATDKEPETEPQLPSTSTSIPPPATQPLVAPPASQPTSNMTLDVGQTTSTYPPLPKAPTGEDVNGSGATSNRPRTTLPAPPSGTTDGSVGAASKAPNTVAATIPTTHPSSFTPTRFPEHRLQPIPQPPDFSSQALQPFVHPADINLQEAQPLAHSADFSPHAAHLIVDVSTANHISHHVAQIQGQCTDEPLPHQQYQQPHLQNLSARSVMDIDQDMGEPLEPAYNSHASSLTAITQPPQSEVLHSAFSTQSNPLFDVPHQVPPPPVIEPSQPTQPVHFQFTTNGYENSFSHSLNQIQLNNPFLSTSNQFEYLHQNITQAGYACHTAPSVGSVPTASYPPSVEPSFEPQWHQVQFSASAPASCIPCPSCSGVGQVQQPAFHPHTSYPLPIHQDLLPPQPRLVNPDYSHNSQNASACSQFIISLSARKTPKPVQQKTSIVLEDETEWARRVAEVQRPQRINPFQSFFRGGPALIPQIDESGSRLYRPLPSRTGGRKIMPPVGSEEDLVARLALQREFEAEQARRAPRHGKRKKRAKRESEDDNEIPVKKQKIRDRSMVNRKERGSCKPQPIVQPPAAKPKPLARTRSCPSVSNLMKTVLRL